MLVGLDDHRVAGAGLLVAAGLARSAHRKNSPRTQRLHVAKHLSGLGAVVLVSGQTLGLFTQGSPSSLAGGGQQSGPDSSGDRRAVAGQDLEGRAVSPSGRKVIVAATGPLPHTP